ncbi:hypothetical protein C8J34_1187 [Rhizobium sp. PP-F2F-G36]|nr:hypothetical protein C8J34_1187 [Rhizobium sp. PP-F2F-G36]
MTKTIASIDASSPAYWTERRIAFGLIRDAEEAAATAACAPTYIFGGYDEDGDAIPLENLQPWDDLDTAIRNVTANAVAVGILAATGRTEIGGIRVV